MSHPDLSHFAVDATEFAVRVTPRASKNRIEDEGDQIRVYVTTVPENGKANTAVRKLLAKAIGIAPSRLVLVAGDTSRDKRFRVELR